MNTSMFNGMFGKIEAGKCRLSLNGDIAVKTSNGYKYYNLKSGRLVNCDNFAFDIGEDFFFVIPTNHVNVGDIILVNGKPKCVKNVEKDSIVAINYEDNTIDTILPERHVLMGKTYFYGKIISMLGSNFFKGGKAKGINGMMKYMMLSEMMKGGGFGNISSSGSGMNNLLPMMMLGGNLEGMFDSMFDFDFESELNSDEDEESEESDDLK